MIDSNAAAARNSQTAVRSGRPEPSQKLLVLDIMSHQGHRRAPCHARTQQHDRRQGSIRHSAVQCSAVQCLCLWERIDANETRVVSCLEATSSFYVPRLTTPATTGGSSFRRKGLTA